MDTIYTISGLLILIFITLSSKLGYLGWALKFDATQIYTLCLSVSFCNRTSSFITTSIADISSMSIYAVSVSFLGGTTDVKPVFKDVFFRS